MGFLDRINIRLRQQGKTDSIQEPKNDGSEAFKYYLLGFMLAVYPLIVIPYQQNYFYAPRYFILAIISLTALFIIIREKIKLNHPAAVPLAAFLFFAVISTLLAPDKLTALLGLPFRLTGFTTYFFCIILFILAAQSVHSEKLLRAAIWSCVIVSLIAVLQYIGINPVPHEYFRDKMISYGTMGNPNFLGTYTCFFLPAAILSYIYSKKKCWLLAASLIYAGVLVSITRGVWISSFLVFLMVVWYCLKHKDWRRPIAITMIMFILVTAVLAPLRDGLILARAGTIQREIKSGIELQDSAGASRMYIWKECFKLLPENWLFGMGPEHLQFAKITGSGNSRALADKAHNVYLEMAVTTGIFTLISYLAFLSFFLRHRKGKREFLFFSMVAVYIVQAFFNIDVVMVMPVWWIILGLSLAPGKPAPCKVDMTRADEGTILPGT